MKLDYSAGRKDELFSKVFQCVNQACPFDVFVQLPDLKIIDYISLRTNHITLSIDGYSFEKGALDHVITINSSSDDPQLTGAQLLIESNITGSQLILNPFISLRQPEAGSAISAGYWKNGSFVAKLPKVAFSILDTLFTAPVFIDSDSGLMFRDDDISILSSYKAGITGRSYQQNNWDDISLIINGDFKTGPDGSFVSDLETYVHDYANIKVQDARERVLNTQLAVERTKSLIREYNDTLTNKQTNLTTLNDLYTIASNKVAQFAEGINQAQDLIDNANSSQLAVLHKLQSICTDLPCADMCLPTVMCKSCDNQLTIDNWGIVNNIQLEELLQYQRSLVTEEKWNIQRLCRIITKIRSWAVVSFGQICSYKTVFSNVTHEAGVTYIERVNVSQIQAAIVNTLEYILNEFCCQSVMCGAQSSNYSCTVSNAGCHIAQTSALNTMTDAQQALVAPLLQLPQAKINHSIAQVESTLIESQINATQVAINQTQKVLQNLLSQYQQALDNLQSVQEDQQLMLTIWENLNTSTIQQLLRLNGVSFTANISNESTSTLINVSITCSIPVTDATLTITDTIDLTAALPLIQRDLANRILNSLGIQLESGANKRKRSILIPSFNKQQFETKCASLNDLKGFLTQLNQSLEYALGKAQEIKSNLSDAAASIPSILSTNTLNFSQINFSYLQSEFHIVLEPENLLTQATTDPSIVNLTSAIIGLRRSILLQSLEIDSTHFISWQTGMVSLYKEGITMLANTSCYGFTDCLTVLTNVLRDLISDAPSNIIDHNLMSFLSTAKQALLQLSLSTNISLVGAASLDNGVNDIVHHIEDAQYWCSRLPIITQHPKSTVHVVMNDTLTLESAAESIQPLRYRWKKDGFTLQISSSPVLVIAETTLLDEGQYQCTVMNNIGTVGSHLANVYIIVPPTIVLSPSDTMTFEGSDNGGWFACNASGHPTPGYQWFYSLDKSNWTLVEDSASNELVVFKPTLSEEGWYRCRAFIGGYVDYSEPAFLIVRRASFSTLNFPIEFLMILLNKNPTVPTNNTDGIKHMLYNKLRNHTLTHDDQIGIKNFELLYSHSNSRVTVDTGFYLEFDYSLFILISDQADLALPHMQDLIQSTLTLEGKMGELYFDINDVSYISLRQSLLIGNIQYLCSAGQGVTDGNFICSK